VSGHFGKTPHPLAEPDDEEEDVEGPFAGLRVYSEMLRMAGPKWAVQGLLQSGTSALLFGRSDALKSFLAVDIGCSIATDTPWHGAPVIPGGVLYVSTEGGAGVGALRIPAWMDAHNIPPEARKAIALYPHAVALDDPATIDGLIDRVRWEHRGGGGDWLPESENDSSLGLLIVDIFGGSMAGFRGYRRDCPQVGGRGQ
jgi:hypothetical protein